MAVTVALAEQVEIPLDLRSLSDFRHWAQSDDFPEQGRIDYIVGRIEVDMAPEDFFCHATPKTELVRVLAELVKQRNLGYLVTDRTRISCPTADLSVEPDVVFVSREALATGRARLVPKAAHEPGRYVELEGAPDLVVEIVSDRSEVKDTRRLPDAYFRAGVREFWLADFRRDPAIFRIHRRGRSGFRPVAADKDGFQRSEVLDCRFRLDRSRDPEGQWVYDLRQKA